MSDEGSRRPTRRAGEGGATPDDGESAVGDGDGATTASDGAGSAAGDGDGATAGVGDDEAPARDDADDAYGGLFGAFPYAVRASDSRLFKSYVLVGGLVAALVGLLFALGLVVLLGNTVGTAGGTFSFSRAFFVFVGFVVVAPLVAPVLFVARRHRRGRPDASYDAALAATGYLFLGSLYVGLVILTPADSQESVTGPLAPVVEALYALPQVAGAAPPLLAACSIWLVARRWGRS